MPGYKCHPGREYRITSGDGTVFTLVPASDGVRAIATVAYSIRGSGGGDSAGTQTCIPGASIDLYNDGVDVYSLSISVFGAVTVSRTAGVEMFNALIHLVFI